MIRTYLGNWMISTGRSLARSDGREMAVTLSEHSIGATMVDPSEDATAWDEDLYRHGNVFYRGYANPIKPRVNHNDKLENPDEIDNAHATEVDEGHVKLISSSRFGDFMRQNLIGELLNPRSHWKMVMYLIAGNIVITFLTIIMVLYANGSF